MYRTCAQAKVGLGCPEQMVASGLSCSSKIFFLRLRLQFERQTLTLLFIQITKMAHTRCIHTIHRPFAQREPNQQYTYSAYSIQYWSTASDHTPGRHTHCVRYVRASQHAMRVKQGRICQLVLEVSQSRMTRQTHHQQNRNPEYSKYS